MRLRSNLGQVNKSQRPISSQYLRVKSCQLDINNILDISFIIVMPIISQPHVSRNTCECQEFQNSFYLQHLANPAWTPAYPGYYNEIQTRFWQYGSDHEWVPPFFTGVVTTHGLRLPYSEPLYLFPSHFLYED